MNQIMKKKNNILNTKEKILAESVRLFSEKGFDGTGIDEIAKNVGITKSVIYYHFKNKEDILNIIIANLKEEHITYKMKLNEKYLSSSHKDMYTYLKEIIFDFWNTRKDIIKILMMESIKKSDRKPLIDFWKSNIFDPIENLIPDYSEEEKFNISLNSFFNIFMPNIVYMIFSEEWSNYNNYEIEKAKDAYLEAYVDIIKNMVPKFHK